VQDASGGIWVDLRGIQGKPQLPGQVLDLHGVAAFGFAPYIAKPQWTVVGEAPPPKPLRLTYEQASTGVLDSQWVEMEGVVRSFMKEAEGNVLVIDVAGPAGDFKVRVPDYHAPFPMHLVDAKVRFRGVCGSAFNRRNQLVAIHLFMPSLADSTVLNPAPADPFSIPATLVGNIRKFSADLSDIRRVKIIGTVTARFPQRGIFLMDSTGGLYVESQDGTPVQPGDEAEVIGFPAAGKYTPVLKSGSIRATGRHHQITPVNVSGQSALRGGYDAQLVNITGTVRGYRVQQNYSVLVMESDDHMAFEASLRSLSGEGLASIGSRVSLTGVCSVRADDNGNPSEFQIVLRDPSDVRILASSPWLDANRAVSLMGAFGVITLGVAAWVFVLRRRVRQQTDLIRLKLANEASLEERYRRTFEQNLTGLYMANEDGDITDCNDSCAHILGFSSREDLLQHRREAGQITRTFYDGHLVQDGGTTEIVNAEHRFTRRGGSTGWVLSNARCVQQRSDGQIVIEGGLVDITDRKLAEEQIQFLAYYDSLTGLPNRTLLQDRLAKALASAKRHRDKVGVLFLDLDRFKNINDSLGHSQGDLLLQELAIRLQTWAREQDTVARLGGDEFIIVLSSIREAADAAVAAERVAHSI